MEEGRLCAAVWVIFLTLNKGLTLDAQQTTSTTINGKERSNINMTCIDNGALPCSDNNTWKACLSRMEEDQPGCSGYNFYTIESVQTNCSSTQPVCKLSTTVIRATKSRHGHTWECSSYQYDVDAITTSTSIAVTVPVTTVQITFPPTTEITLEQNASRKFVCRTSASSPHAVVQWYKRLADGKEVPIPGGTTSTVPNGTLVVTTSQLQYTVSRVDFKAEIYCKARTDGSPRSLAVTSANTRLINVRCSPRRSVDVESNIRIVKSLHQAVTLSLRVAAYPAPVFTWFMASGFTGWINVTDGVVSNGMQSHLFFDRLERDDFGQYRVEVGNNIKPDYVQLFTIQEGDPGPVPGHSLAVVIGSWCGGMGAGILLMLVGLLLCKRSRKGHGVASYEMTRAQATTGRVEDHAQTRQEPEMMYENTNLEGQSANVQRNEDNHDYQGMDQLNCSEAKSCDAEDYYEEI